MALLRYQDSYQYRKLHYGNEMIIRLSTIIIYSFTDAGHPSGLPRISKEVMKLCKVSYVFEHKMQYLLIHAPFTLIVVFWHIGNEPAMILYSQICCSTATFCIAAIFVKYCYTTSRGCYNPWANLWCWSCSPLGEKSLWNGTFPILVRWHLYTESGPRAPRLPVRAWRS